MGTAAGARLLRPSSIAQHWRIALKGSSIVEENHFWRSQLHHCHGTAPVYSHTRGAHPSSRCLQDEWDSLCPIIQIQSSLRQLGLPFFFLCPCFLCLFILLPSPFLPRWEWYSPCWCYSCCTPVLYSCLWGLWLWDCVSAVSILACWPTLRTCWTTKVLPLKAFHTFSLVLLLGKIGSWTYTCSSASSSSMLPGHASLLHGEWQ